QSWWPRTGHPGYRRTRPRTGGRAPVPARTSPPPPCILVGDRALREAECEQQRPRILHEASVQREGHHGKHDRGDEPEAHLPASCPLEELRHRYLTYGSLPHTMRDRPDPRLRLDQAENPFQRAGE